MIDSEKRRGVNRQELAATLVLFAPVLRVVGLTTAGMERSAMTVHRARPVSKETRVSNGVVFRETCGLYIQSPDNDDKILFSFLSNENTWCPSTTAYPTIRQSTKSSFVSPK